jgi:hypothetical protein
MVLEVGLFSEDSGGGFLRSGSFLKKQTVALAPLGERCSSQGWRPDRLGGDVRAFQPKAITRQKASRCPRAQVLATFARVLCYPILELRPRRQERRQGRQVPNLGQVPKMVFRVAVGRSGSSTLLLRRRQGQGCAGPRRASRAVGYGRSERRSVKSSGVSA